MRPTFLATVAKYAADAHLNEDAADGIPIRGVYAVSDGASDSYNSARWSHILVSRFCRHPRFDARWLRDAVDAYSVHFNRDTMSWRDQGAFDRGSFATLTGVVVAPSGATARVLGFGDSIAVLADGFELRASFPYERSDQFVQDPLLLSTDMGRNKRVLERSLLTHHTRTWPLFRLRHPALLFMTDALGAWLLKAPRERLKRLLELRTRIQFAGFVEHERSAGRLKRDDTTLLVVR